jgi:tetratricopeptide (TPR) repeat protein
VFEVVTVGALAAFLTAVANGAAGEMGKQLLLSTGAQVRRLLGRETALPAAADQAEELARRLQPLLNADRRQAADWALLLQSLPGPDPALVTTAGPGLPPPTRDFTDRSAVLRRLDREAARPAGGRPRAALLYGAPGIGTSAVALHWGFGRAARFPDGRFHLDLRDLSGDRPPEPAEVLSSLLRRMGVASDRIPATESGREQLYRRLTADRRVLVVVDHVSAAAQVRPLVPATPEPFLLAVSSGPALAAVEAERIAVPPLRERDAKELLRRLAGHSSGPPVSGRHLNAVLRRCAGNAYALKAAARQLASQEPLPTGPSDPGDPAAEHDPVLAAVRESCRCMPPATARLCRLAALGGWPAVDADMAAWAADVDRESAVRMLGEAAELQLTDPLPDGRWRLRPAVRRCLEEDAAAQDGIAECAAAVSRVLDGLLLRARHAAHAALPQSWRTEPAPARGRPCRDEADGMTVLRAGAATFVRAVFVARDHERTVTAAGLARALWPLQLKAGHWDEVLPALRTAARCADERRLDARTSGALHFQLAHCLGELRRWDEADEAARVAVAAERSAGHPRGEASAVELLGLLRLYRLDWSGALERFAEAERLYGRIGPGDEGAADLPRARALIERHQGRALRGLGRLEEARERLERARDFFAARGEAYNEARALTDLAEVLHDAGEDARALARIGDAVRLLSAEQATPHLHYLARLRERCEAAARRR